MFPTWPAKSEMAAGANGGAKKAASPKPPSGKFLSILISYGVFNYVINVKILRMYSWRIRELLLRCICVSGGGAFKKINDEDEMDSKVAGFALRGNALGLPQPANASWNLKF